MIHPRNFYAPTTSIMLAILTVISPTSSVKAAPRHHKRTLQQAVPSVSSVPETTTPEPPTATWSSAALAAWLANTPPPGWIQHYLPDDRYKIVGGIWQYVSTDVDSYYHKPGSPEMLKQPADNVIGFASRHDAEEAGYLPGPSVTAGDDNSPGASPSTGAEALAEMAQLGEIASSATYNRSNRPRTITLSDNESQVLLPAGWWRESRVLRDPKYSAVMSYDLLRPIKSLDTVPIQGILINITHTPGDTSTANIVSYNFEIGLQREILAPDATSDPAIPPDALPKLRADFSNLIISPVTLGNAAGFSLRNRDGSPLSGVSDPDSERILFHISPLVVPEKISLALNDKFMGISVAGNLTQSSNANKILNSLSFR